ncbi:hypothetical protein CHS0354_017209 [Potamilus streckersoni]|uniref:N-acetylphosphatidylethanolamine-hydrolyzing phospholipase D n=1 Tax=Potamilus streckersoni TaxID=2493646 RepID=A0AAE0RXY3_9BIVA|nr:hypothetical protein CHS0354_017209 [Potamilus streckersoni]
METVQLTELLCDLKHKDVPEKFRATKEVGRWKNLWNPWEHPGFSKLWRWFQEKDNSNIPKNEKDLDKELPLVTPKENPANYAKLCQTITDGVQVMWIGHATVLVRFDGLTVLTDPIFADRCNPISNILPVGTKRYRKAPCTVNDLPNIDAVIISHDHYDHLCHYTVNELNKQYGDKITWFVPMDLKEWLTGSGCKKVEESEWWQEKELDVNGRKFQFICTPCQHWCMRGPFDENKALWCSWVIKGPEHSFFFAGDTGYHQPLFQYIGDRYGPFSCAAIPIGAYKPRWMMQYQHVNPEEAVNIHNNIKAKYSVGIHWGTFHQTNEHYLEPKEMIEKTLQPKHSGKFVTLQHGEVRLFTD